MSQIRVKALKGEGKTTSRKAKKSGRASGIASPAGSDILQRVFHQDEQNYKSDFSASPPETPAANDDIDDPFTSGQVTDDEGVSGFDPKKLVFELQDKRNNQGETREFLLRHYVNKLKRHYDEDLNDIDTKELVETLLRGANRGPTASERKLSLQAYILTILTADLTNAESPRATLKQVMADDDDDDCQIQALYALTLTTVYFGAGEEDTIDYIDFLISLVQDNGEGINALGKDVVMVAIFECLAFSATHVDLSQQADYAMDAFVEKLDSTDTETQAIAAESIAYLFEASRAHEHEEGQPFELPYDPARLASRIEALTKGGAKSKSRKSRRDLRESLQSVVTSLERGVGPFYSTAHANDRNGEMGKVMGYRYKLRRQDENSGFWYTAPVESWHHYLRIIMLRNVFGGGLERHVSEQNPMIQECLEGLDWSIVAKTDSKGRRGRNDFFDNDDD